jgi:hypothetical protein
MVFLLVECGGPPALSCTDVCSEIVLDTQIIEPSGSPRLRAMNEREAIEMLEL